MTTRCLWVIFTAGLKGCCPDTSFKSGKIVKMRWKKQKRGPGTCARLMRWILGHGLLHYTSPDCIFYKVLLSPNSEASVVLLCVCVFSLHHPSNPAPKTWPPLWPVTVTMMYSDLHQTLYIHVSNFGFSALSLVYWFVCLSAMFYRNRGRADPSLHSRGRGSRPPRSPGGGKKAKALRSQPYGSVMLTKWKLEIFLINW